MLLLVPEQMGGLNKGGSENSVKSKKRGGVRLNGGEVFVYVDPNDVNVLKFAYMRAKL